MLFLTTIKQYVYVIPRFIVIFEKENYFLYKDNQTFVRDLLRK